MPIPLGLSRLAGASVSAYGEDYQINATDGYRLERTSGGDAIFNNTDDDVYDYDDGGRVTTIDRGGDPWTLEYNAAGQIVKIHDVGTPNTIHSYESDAFGRRISSAVDSVKTNFLIAPAAQRLGAGVLDVEVQHLASDSNGTVMGWIYAGENPILRYDGNNSVQYYLEDASDSIRALISGNAGQVQVDTTYDYDAFGVAITGGDEPTSDAGGDFGYHAAWRDDTTELYHMRARAYDVETGRFLTPDPADGVPEAPESYNMYSFANNNPHLYSDPTGLFSIAEVSVSGTVSQSIDGYQSALANQARRFAIDKRLRIKGVRPEWHCRGVSVFTCIAYVVRVAIGFLAFALTCIRVYVA